MHLTHAFDCRPVALRLSHPRGVLLRAAHARASRWYWALTSSSVARRYDARLTSTRTLLALEISTEVDVTELKIEAANSAISSTLFRVSKLLPSIGFSFIIIDDAQVTGRKEGLSAFNCSSDKSEWRYALDRQWQPTTTMAATPHAPSRA